MKTSEMFGLGLGVAGLALGVGAIVRGNRAPAPAQTPTGYKPPSHMGGAAAPVVQSSPASSPAPVNQGGEILTDISAGVGIADQVVDLFNNGESLFDSSNFQHDS